MSQRSFAVQILRVRWNKGARGGALAQKRGALPQKFERLLPTSPARVVFETHDWDGWNGFEDTGYNQTEHPLIAPLRRPLFEFDGQWGWIWLDAATFGIPRFDFMGEEGPTSQRRFLIPQTSWFQARWNGRFVDFDDGNWWYEQTTLNASQIRDGETLFAGEPTCNFSRMVILR